MDNKSLKNGKVPKYRICVSGAAETEHCGDKAFELAVELGAEIIHQGALLIDGATTGFPFWASKGAKEAGGIVIGFSPASTIKEHTKVYKLPTEYHDIIVYTGFGYAGRNLLLTRSSDAVIVGCGRLGTLNEFTIAFEDHKPIGVLEGEGWATDDLIKDMIARSHRGKGKIVYDSDPKKLVEKLIKVIDEDREETTKTTTAQAVEQEFGAEE